MPITVPIPRRLTGETAIPFPDALFENYEVDATKLQFVEPLGMVQLALLLHHLASIGWVTFKAPSDTNVGNYLARMAFYENLPTSTLSVEGAVDPTSIRKTNCSDVLIPVSRFTSPEEVEDLFETVLTYLREAAVSKILPPSTYSALVEAVPELCGNVASHSSSPCGGFLVGQTYGRQSIYMAVGDIGIGIREHLTRNPLYADIETDVEAIRRAIQPGVTGTRDRRGYGYDVVIEELQNTSGAVLFVRSGNGWVRTTVNRASKRRQSGTSSVTCPGTMVQLIIHS